MTGPLAQQIAQVREALESPGFDGWGAHNPPDTDALAALSSIERHVQDMEKALRQADYVADLAEDWPGATDKPLQAAVCEYRIDRAALPAREKEEE